MTLYLGRHNIPQSPPVNAENFARTFYGPLIDSFCSMLHLYDLLSHDSSNVSNNASKMPVPGMGTRESPGHISLWLISLGQQKDAFFFFFLFWRRSSTVILIPVYDPRDPRRSKIGSQSMTQPLHEILA